MRVRQEELRCTLGYSGGQMLMGILAGAAAGALVAYFTAPASGRATRDRLRRLAEDSRGKVNRLPGALAEATQAAGHAFTDKMGEALSEHPRRT